MLDSIYRGLYRRSIYRQKDTTLINKTSATYKVKLRETAMSKKREKKRERRSPMPAQSAGLLRFFEEETEGIKVKPELAVGIGVALVITCILALIFFQ